MSGDGTEGRRDRAEVEAAERARRKVADRLGVPVDMVRVGHFASDERWLTDGEWPPAGERATRGDVVTRAEAGRRLGMSALRVWALVAVGRLDRAGRGLVTTASVEAEVARRGEAVAS